MLPNRPTSRADAVAIFTRTPVPGKAKTRLIPLLGPRRAAQFQAALVCDAIRKVDALGGSALGYLFVVGRGRLPGAWLNRGGKRRFVAPGTLVRQRGADLGERLEQAFRWLLHRHAAALVIGADSPLLPPSILRQALRELRLCEAVLGPCPDGGYYLIGLQARSGAIPEAMFCDIRWGSAYAFRDTLRNLLDRDFSCSVMEVLEDIDRPEDFLRLRRQLVRDRAARRLAPAVWRFLRDMD